MRPFVAALAVAASLIACIRYDEEPPASGEASPPSSSDAGPDALLEPSRGCPPGCAASAPDGWTGPSAVYEGPFADRPTICPGGAPPALEAFTLGQSEEPACRCGPSTPSGWSCSTSFALFKDAGCSGTLFPSPTIDSSDECFAYDLTALGYVSARPLLPSLRLGVCSPPEATVPPPKKERAQLACSLPAAACQGRSDCVVASSEAPFSRLCLHARGDVPCPSADYAVRFVSFTSVADSRTCRCDVEVGASCGGFVDGAATTVCGGPKTSISLMAGSCSAIADARSIETTRLAPRVECQVSGGAAGGALEPRDPVTFCCDR